MFVSATDHETLIVDNRIASILGEFHALAHCIAPVLTEAGIFCTYEIPATAQTCICSYPAS